MQGFGDFVLLKKNTNVAIKEIWNAYILATKGVA
jgi:hypothetical protein